MERERANFPKPEETVGKKDKDDTARNKREGLLTVPRDKEYPLYNPRQKDSKPLYEALADSLLTKDDKFEVNKEASLPDDDKEVNENHPKDAFEDTRELTPHEFYIGEGVLTLEGAGVEHEIPLYAHEDTPPTTVSLNREVPTKKEIPSPTAESPTEPVESAKEFTSETSVETIEVPDPTPMHEGGDKPPIDPPESPPEHAAAEPPERPFVPMPVPEAPMPPRYEGSVPSQVLLNPNLLVDTEKTTDRKVEEAYYYGQKEGQRRGVVAGAVVAGAYEHFKHRRREKKLIKQQRKQEKQIEHLTKQQAYLEQESPAQHPTYEERLNRVVSVLEQKSPVPVAPSFSEAKPAEVKAPNLELLKQLQPEIATQEQAHLAPERRVETSAWHRIEMDAKTGKVVDDPSLEYGQEYYRERQQEAAPRGQHLKEAAGEVALVADALNQTNEGPQKLPRIPLASAKEQTVKAKDFVQATAKSMVQPNGPIWPYYVVLGVILFLILISL